MLFTACSSCNRGGRETKSSSTAEQQRPRQRKSQIAIASPKNNEQQPLGAAITLSVTTKDGAETIDSLRWFIDGKWLKTNKGEDTAWDTGEQTVGTHRIEAVAHYASGQRDIVPATVFLLAPQAPRQYGYKVMRVYPHDPKAYTQGLLFDDGFLYESTGLEGESSLRQVNFQTGHIVQVTNLPAEIFGEGLALVDDKLIQLSYKNQTAFVYRKSDFKLLNRISYPMREGWGLTCDGTHLLMTDGSATVYFLDREYLTEVRRLEVCDNKGIVPQLNELEHISGELWANVYYTDDILRIDPKTGAVLGCIHLDGLLKNSDRKADTDVLNGIAYDEKTGRIFVTGKNWPKLFEIQVIGK
ncbi:MAG: glutaminyl-peptide cyclotransferase [Prevotellaceae bacterium]|jgi:glutamine cyclotransferase|nr:glutaminyl-peptide cyclotransferase [Prevotellaceae bacterium]